MPIKNCYLIEPFKCKSEESVVDVAKKLREITLRHIFVVDDKDYPIGIISMTDINNRVVAEGKDPKNLKAEDIMSKVDVIDINDPAKKWLEKMLKENHVMNPVVKDNKFIGIVTIHQLLKEVERNEK